MAEQVRFWHSNTSNLYDSSNGNLKNGDIIFSQSLGQILDWETKTFYGIQWVSGTSGDALLRLRHDYFSNNKQGDNTVDVLTTNASVTNLHSYLTIKTNGPLTGAPTNKSEGLVTLGINSADASNLGVVYLSDSTSSTLDASSHHAASSKAVKDAMDKAISAYNLANSKTNNTGTVTSITPGIGLTNGTTKNSITTSGTLNLKSASATELGGIQIGYSDNNRNYGVLLDNNKAYVHIPWTDTTYTLSSKGSNASNANDNNNPYIQIGNNANQKIKITGRGKTSVTRTSDQEITINSTWPTLSDLSGISSITYSGTVPSGAYFVSSTTASGNTVSVNYGILSGSKHITVSKATNSNNIAISIDSGYSIPSDQSLANFQNAYNWFVSVTDPSVNGKIDKWNEIEAFLKDISDSSTLTGIIESNSASLTNNLTISIDSSTNGVINVKQGGNLVKSLDFSHTHKWDDITNKPSLVNSIAGQTGAVTVNAIISTLEEGTSIITDNTEILTSYASNNGFADSNAKNTLYKRDAVHLYDYIKTKLGTDKFNTTYSYSVTQSATNNNANPYLTLTPSNSGTVSNIQLAGGSNVTITRDSASKIIISSSWRPLGTGSNDAAAGNHTHTWASITDKLVANEFNIVNTGFNEEFWFNYLPINDRSTTAVIKGYHFGNGAKDYAPVVASSFIKSGGSSSQFLKADGSVDSTNYLPLSGGTMGGTAVIAFPDSGNWSNSNKGVTFPVRRGGFSWSGQSDGIELYAEESSNDNLNLVLKFTDDNSNGLSIRNANGVQTAFLAATGTITAPTFNGNADMLDGAHLSDIKNWCDRTASAYWKAGWYKVASASTGTNTEAFLTLDVNEAKSNGHATLFIRKRADSKPYFICTHNNNLNLADFRLYYNGMSMVLYARVPIDWNGKVFRIISEGREGKYDHIWTLYSNISSTDPNAISAEGENPYINPTYSGRVDWSNSSDEATRLQTSRTLWGIPFDGTGNVSGDMTGVGNMSLTNPGSTGTRFITGVVGDSDCWRIGGGATASDAGYAEIATADNGTEPIYVRQYTGVFRNVARTATLLDGDGNTSFPGSISEGGQSLSNKYIHQSYFHWSGQGGQPTWIWGGDNQNDYYIYNPSNFSVNYANSANYATSAGTANIANILDSYDERTLQFLPYEVPRGIKLSFQNSNNNGLNSGGFYGLLSWRSYGSGSDLSGGYPFQIAYLQSGDLYTRVGVSSNNWGAWKKVAITTDIPTKVSQLTNDSGFLTKHQSLAHSHTLKIGNTSKSVGLNSSQSWSLSEIGAAAAVHSHNALDIQASSEASLNSTSNSFYVAYVGGNNGHAGKPVGVEAYSVMHLRTAAGWYGEIMLSNANGMYYRSAAEAQFNKDLAWEKLATESWVSGSYVKNNDNRLTNARPASDVYAWAKAASKPSYSWNEINGKPATFTPSTHTHDIVSLANATIDVNTTTNSWDVIGGNNKYLLKSIRVESEAPPYLLGKFSAGVAFGGYDTKGVITVAYDFPSIRIAGGNGATARWYITLNGSANKTYNLDSFALQSSIPTKTSQLTNDSGFVTSAVVNGYATQSWVNGLSLLPKAGGVMGSGAIIRWPDTGNWGKGNSGVTFPVDRGGLRWDGQSDGVYLHAVETANDNLELIIKFTDDNSNGLSIQNTDGATTARIAATGAGSFSSLTVGGQSVVLNNDTRLTNARPASDVYAWAKAASKPSYSWNEINGKPSLVNSIAGQTGAVTVNAIISTLEEGTSIVTDNTEILTSYASNNGFAYSNAKNTLYKRDAVHLYDYIKTKLGIDKFNTTYSQKISQSTTNDNNNPYISLVDSNNSVDNIQISAGTGISIVRNSDDKLTITNTQPDKDHNTHYSTHFYVGSSQSGTNTTTTVKNPYLQIYDDSTYRNQVQLKGEGNSTVTSINGVVTINSIGYTSINHPSSGVIEFSGYGVDDVSLDFSHTHDLSQLTGKIKVECLPDAALKDTTYSYSVTQSATNNNANPYLTLTPSNSGTVSNIQLAGGSNVTITRDSASKIIISSSWRPLGTGSNDAAAGNHTHTWASITDKLVTGNEFNIVNTGFNEEFWFNYLPINDRSTTAVIKGYHFGNGAKDYAPVVASSFIKSGGSSSQFLKADGSVDSTNYLPLSGGTITGTTIIDGNNKSVPLILKGGIRGYTEGLRIISATDEWSDIVLGGTDLNESTGISANSWFIGNNNGKFYITRNGASSLTDYNLNNRDGTWKINDYTILHSGNYSSVLDNNYLRKSGGTMGGTAVIAFPDSGNIRNKNKGVTFPVRRGGFSWSGQTDGIELYAEESSNDNLNLVLKFTDDNSNGLSIRNASGTQTAFLAATGTITAPTFNGNLNGNLDVGGTRSGNGIYAGTGDGATYTTYNLRISSWWGIGFYDECNDKTHMVINTRTGDLSTEGKLTAASAVIGGSDVWTKGSLTVGGQSVVLNNDTRLTNARPASDVYAWAKAASKPSYSWNEINGKPATFTPSTHTHDFLVVARNTGDSSTHLKNDANNFAGKSNVFYVDELAASSQNAPNSYWNYILSMNGSDSNHAGQIALGMNVDGMWFRNKHTEWTGWKKVAITTDIPTKVSQLTNDSGFLTQHQSLAHTHTLTIGNSTKAVSLNGTQSWSISEIGAIPGYVAGNISGVSDVSWTNSYYTSDGFITYSHYSGHSLGSYRQVVQACSSASGTGLELNANWCVNPTDPSSHNNLYFRVKRDAVSNWGPYSRLLTDTDLSNIDSKYVKKSGDTMTGALSVAGSLSVGGNISEGGQSLSNKYIHQSYFHWSGQGGQPTWIWGGDNQNDYYIYNPSNFSVNYANSAGNADTAIKLKDYNGSTNIYCGYAGAGLTSDNIGYMVGIQVNGNNIYYKNVNKSELQKWLGFNASDFVKALGTSNDNIDSDWGQSFKTFDPIPSGTPPEQNPNISLLSIGNDFGRRKQLAFMHDNDNIYYRRHVDGAFTNWKRIAFVDDISGLTVNTTSNKQYVLGVSGTGSQSTAYINTDFYFTGDGPFYTSDINYKHDFAIINNNDIDTFFNHDYFKHFKWNSTNKSSWGVIAQEVETWIPEAVDIDEKGKKAVNYDVVEAKAIAALTAKVKQQQEEINKLKQIINEQFK